MSQPFMKIFPKPPDGKSTLPKADVDLSIKLVDTNERAKPGISELDDVNEAVA